MITFIDRLAAARLEAERQNRAAAEAAKPKLPEGMYGNRRPGTAAAEAEAALDREREIKLAGTINITVKTAFCHLQRCHNTGAAFHQGKARFASPLGMTTRGQL